MTKVFEQRDYQNRIHTKALDYLETPSSGIAKTVLIESPTGSGKTVMALRLAKALEEKGHKIGFVAHRKELLNQATKTNEEFFGCKTLTPISLFNRTPEQFNYCSVVVVDECQHDASKSASILHDAIRPEIIVGLTATPYRTDKAQLCFQKVIRDAGIHQLIREGYLAEFTQWIVDDEWTPENVARLYLEQPEEWGKSVIYFLTSVDALACDALLKAAGVRAACILGSTKNREEILEDFKSGIIQVVTNVAVLTEGFDEPSLKTAFVRPSSKGPTVQMAGRAFRKHPDLPLVNIVQNGETRFPFTRHARAYNQMIRTADGWTSIDPKNLAPIFRKQRIKVASANYEMPQYIKKKMKKRSIMVTG
jgi:superfamily II DNA or RNA helicase